MYFGTKNHLKSNRYHTAKRILSDQSLANHVIEI